MSTENPTPQPPPMPKLPVIPIAHVGKRLVCAVLDFTVIFLLLFFLLTKFFWPMYYPETMPSMMEAIDKASKNPDISPSELELPLTAQEGIGFSLVMLAMITWFYFVISEVFTQGSSLGKSVFGLRVLSLRGTPPHALEIGVRASVKATSFLIFFPVFLLINLMLMLMNKQRRTGHDRMANTLVIAGRGIVPKKK